MSEASGQQLPPGWATANLGDVLEVIRGVTYRKEESRKAPDVGFIPVLRATNIQNTLGFEGLVYVPAKVVSEIQTLRPADIVVAASSGSLSVVGKAAQLKHEWVGSFGAFCFCLRPAPAIESRILGWFLHTTEYRNRVSKAAAGVNINNLRAEHIEQTPFRIPPFGEQVRIADELDELLSDLDAGVAALERVRAKLKHYRAAVLKAAVEGALTAEWRTQHPATEPASALLTRILTERRRRWEEAQLQKFKVAGKAPPKDWKTKYQEPVGPDTADLPSLPEDWCWVSLDQLAGDSSIGLDRGLQYQRTTPPGSPYIKMNNVTMDGRVLFDHLVFVETTEEDRERYSLVAGDLLFNTRNSTELVGKVGIVLQAPTQSVYNNNLMRIRFDGAALPAFACYQMCSGGFRNRMEKVKKATTSVAAVYSKDLFPLQLALPPLAEQEAIIEAVEDQLSVIEHLEADLEAKLKNAQALRQSILRHAFTGQLVPQDPKDEPAAELLKRIAAQREELARQAQAAKKTKPKAPPKRAVKQTRKKTLS